MIKLHESGPHKNVYFNDLTSGQMVQANQHLIVDGDEGIILDPGGHKVHSRLFAQMTSVLPVNRVKHIFFSHQDPDIVAAANAWLMVTDASAYLSDLWIRFLPHFGVDELVQQKIKTIPDGGRNLKVGNTELKILPAHFLHSCGNFHVYDPVSRILYSGDLGASFNSGYERVDNFDTHIQYIEGFHRRYMSGNKALRMWVGMVRTLDIDIIAPQHGSIYPDGESVGKLLDWLEGLECGTDLIGDKFKIPE